MKLLLAITVIATPAVSAFAVPSVARVNTAHSVVSDLQQTTSDDVASTPRQQIEVDVQEVGTTTPLYFSGSVPESIEPGRLSSLDYSVSLPLLTRPPHLDGSHAGDFGFDPLGWGSTDLYAMQEAELRHARLAMLAVVGWPLSELVGPDFMLVNGAVPSVLNGGNIISGVAIVSVLA